MNGAFDKLQRIARLPRWAASRQNLSRFGVPAMAIVGVGAITAVLLGVQCGGLDKCFAGTAPGASVVVGPAAVPPATDASLGQTTVSVAPAPAEAVAPAPPAAEVAVTKAAEVSEGVQRARRVDEMIGDTFVALASDDAGWLAGAAANAVADVETYAEGDGAGPPAARDDETAAEAANAVAETPVQPLERPTPLDVAAFAEQSAETAADVKVQAQRKLAEVAKSEPDPVVEPEPAAAPPPAAEPEPVAEPELRPAATAEGDTRTVAGAGVNVRSGPGKSNAKVFGLAGGEKVRVGENQRGWLKITDDQGRTGWVYKDYLN